MTDQQKRELLWLVGFVAVMGTLVIAVVSALLARWRRRLLGDGRSHPSADAMPDLWKVGGQRLTRQMDAGDDDDVNPFDSGDPDQPDSPGPGPSLNDDSDDGRPRA